MAPKIAGPKAKEDAQKALELDESNAEAHVVLAIESQWYEWDWAANRSTLDRPQWQLGFCFCIHAQWDKAIEQLRSSIDLDPNCWFDHYFLGRAYEQKGRFPEAIAALKQAVSVNSSTQIQKRRENPSRRRMMPSSPVSTSPTVAILQR